MPIESRKNKKNTIASTLPSIQEEIFRRSLFKRLTSNLNVTSTPYRPTERSLIENLSLEESLNHRNKSKHIQTEKSIQTEDASIADINLLQQNIFNSEFDAPMICDEESNVVPAGVETNNIDSNKESQDYRKNWYDIFRERKVNIEYKLNGPMIERKRKKKKQKQNILSSAEQPQLEFGQLLANYVNTTLVNDAIPPNVEVEVSADNKHKSLDSPSLEKPNCSKNSNEDMEDCEHNNIRGISNEVQNEITRDRINSNDNHNKSKENHSINLADKTPNIHRTPSSKNSINNAYKKTSDAHTQFLIDNSDDICVISDNYDRWSRVIVNNKEKICSCFSHSYKYHPEIIVSANKLYLRVKLIILKEIVVNKNVDLIKIKSIRTRLEASIAFSFLLELKSSDVINLSSDGCRFSLK